jgi:5-hydroxyisourate hydrolase-like protein (transthyretin family)
MTNLIICVSAYTQTTNIIGSVVDDNSTKVIPLATVSLIFKDSIVVVGNTNTDGIFDIEFQLTEKQSEYKINISHVKYEPHSYQIKDLFIGKTNTRNFKISPLEKNIIEEEIDYIIETVAATPIVGLASSDSKGRPKVSKISAKRERHFTTTAAEVDYDAVSDYKDIGIEGDGYLSDLEPSDISKSPVQSDEAGVLTAGKIHDFSKWKLWEDIAPNDLKEWRDTWKIKPENRYTLQVSTGKGSPIVDAMVQLMNSKNELLWEARTDNTGKAECWAYSMQRKAEKESGFYFLVNHLGKEYRLNNAKEFHKKINSLKIQSECAVSDNVDIMFVVDATGSMGDEIDYLKTELNDVIQKTKSNNENSKLRLASVFYRDHSDQYVTKKSPFSSNIQETTKFINEQSAGGGGDFPEAVTDALNTAIYTMNWSPNARTRLLFLVLDAPPHVSKLDKLHTQIQKAAEMGIQIIPLSGSGIDKSTEYLMRAIALSTNGTYMFLTNHSGIGGHHISPTTDKFNTEFLNAMLVKFIDNSIFHPGCDNNELSQEIASIDSNYVDSIRIATKDTTQNTVENNNETSIQLSAFPNPSRGLFKVNLSMPLDELLIADITGKLLTKKTMLKSGNNDFATV